jgi:tungstate transport system permease protein
MALTDLSVLVDTKGLGGIVALSIAVSVTAAALAGVLGTALGTALAVYRIPGRRIIVMALHALSSVSPCTCCYRAPGHWAH